MNTNTITLYGHAAIEFASINGFPVVTYKTGKGRKEIQPITVEMARSVVETEPDSIFFRPTTEQEDQGTIRALLMSLEELHAYAMDQEQPTDNARQRAEAAIAWARERGAEL